MTTLAATMQRRRTGPAKLVPGHFPLLGMAVQTARPRHAVKRDTAARPVLRVGQRGLLRRRRQRPQRQPEADRRPRPQAGGVGRGGPPRLGRRLVGSGCARHWTKPCVASWTTRPPSRPSPCRPTPRRWRLHCRSANGRAQGDRWPRQRPVGGAVSTAPRKRRRSAIPPCCRWRRLVSPLAFAKLHHRPSRARRCPTTCGSAPHGASHTVPSTFGSWSQGALQRTPPQRSPSPGLTTTM
mmetsp:Transcript_51853/g.150879  ORF Transcript_51853/g.150879 Transcript_51853/m.150879 type:complete len:239 (-) Transcript_51853:1541-2257(-)